MTFIARYFYRKVRVSAIVAGGICASVLTSYTVLHAQIQRQRPTGPRALGVVEFNAKGPTRMLPIVFYLDGRFYDANFYMAKPIPLALDGGTVYEVQQGGQPTGTLTIDAVQQAGDRYWGLGKWNDFSAPAKPKAAPKAKADPNDDRPKLKRGGQASPASSKPNVSSENTPPASNDEDPDRPVLKKPKTSSGESAPASTSSSAPANVSSTTVAAEPPEDPNRPKLRRGQSSQVQANEDIPKAGARTPAVSAGVKLAGAPVKVLAAVSDPKAQESRPYTYVWGTDDFKQKVMTATAKIASQELAKYATEHRLALPKQLNGTTETRAFDVDYSNTPVMVFTGVYPLALARNDTAPLELYATVVVRIDYDGNPEKIFSLVSDSKHLDSYPRLELIDAVDADGDSRAEFLFRAFTEEGKKFVLYRVTPYRMTEAFETAAMQ